MLGPVGPVLVLGSVAEPARAELNEATSAMAGFIDTLMDGVLTRSASWAGTSASSLADVPPHSARRVEVDETAVHETVV